MAREPMVTRTIKTTVATVMCLDIVAGETCTEVVTLPRTFKDDKAILKAVEKVINNDEIKAVHIIGVDVKENLYGMTENEFIENATVLPPRTSKEN